MPADSHPLVLATHNRDKIDEMRQALMSLPVRILTLDDFPQMPEVDEDGDTLEANARKKASVLCEFTGLPAVADDTGLFVTALNGAPGVFSSRYAGERASYRENVAKLLRAMSAVPAGKRAAVFKTAVAFAASPKHLDVVTGECEGSIALSRVGPGGFGYDPVFIVSGTTRTFAEMTIVEKNVISHRGRALAALRAFLIDYWSK